jgi:hypothetical protein
MVWLKGPAWLAACAAASFTRSSGNRVGVMAQVDEPAPDHADHGNGRRHNVEHATDRSGRRFENGTAVDLLVHHHAHRSHAQTEVARQRVERLSIAAGGDPAFVDLVDRLNRGSKEFSAWWQAHELRSIATGQKCMQHPKKGALRLDYASFQLSEDPALKLTIYTPA